MQTDREFIETITNDATSGLKAGVSALLDRKDVEIGQLCRKNNLLATHCEVALELMANAKLSPDLDEGQRYDWENATKNLRLAIDAQKTEVPARQWGIRFPSRRGQVSYSYLNLVHDRPCLVSSAGRALLFFSQVEALKTALRHCTCAVSLGQGPAEVFEVEGD